MPLDPTATARTYFGHLAAGEIPEALAMLSDRVVWHQPGNNQFSGIHIGRAKVGDVLRRMSEESGNTFKIMDPVIHSANGNLITARTHFTAQRPGADVDTHSIDLIRVGAPDRIDEVWLFTEDIDAEDAFWGQAAGTADSSASR